MWLLIGFIFLIFSNGTNHIIPIATWLAPVFLLRFLRTQSKPKGLLIFLPVYLLGWIIMLYGMYHAGMPAWVGIMTAVVYGIVFYLPFLADRLITPQMKSFASTLVFPCAWVIVEFFLTSLDFTGSWFLLAYTQHGNLPLLQLVSITGIYGISFLITWFASAINWSWEHEFSLPRIWKGISIYFGILISILLLGGAYMTFLPADSDTVRAAAITRSFDIDIGVEECREKFSGEELSDCQARLFDRTLTEFLEDSKKAASLGAKIIVWQENGLTVLQADEPEYVEQAREFAMQENVYLVMGTKMAAKEDVDDENKAIIITPEGEISEYLKNHKVAGDEHIFGDGKVLIQDSAYGTLASVICYDVDFPSFVRQAGNADIMLVPSHDWDGITPIHTRMAHFRPIENGFSMIRADYHGISSAVDYHGNILAQMNDFTTEDRIMIADIPMTGIKTIYSQIGDLFVWLCVLGLLGILGLRFSKLKKI